MYPTILTLHSWLRWLVILLGVWAVASAAGRPAADGRDRPGLFFTIGLDVQLLLGVLLYVALSPITQAALTDMGAAMRNSTWRFWTVEHPALMLLAVVFGHVARIVSRRGSAAERVAGTGRRGSRAPLIWYSLAVLALLAAIPWPFLGYGRPLVRW